MRLLILVAVALLTACSPGRDLSMVGEWYQDEQDALRQAAQGWCVDAGEEYCPTVHAGGGHVPVRVWRSAIPCEHLPGCPNLDDHLDGLWHEDEDGTYSMSIRDRSGSLVGSSQEPASRSEYLGFFRCVTMHEIGHMFGLDDVRDPAPRARLMHVHHCSAPESWDDPVVTAADRAALQ